MDTKVNSFGFEKLEVWKKSRKLVFVIYKISTTFPELEKYSLTNQIRRSSMSIPSNIAEGTSRYSNKDFARFIEIAYGSLMETMNHMYLAFDLNYIDNKVLDEIKIEIISIAKKLSALRRTLNT